MVEPAALGDVNEVAIVATRATPTFDVSFDDAFDGLFAAAYRAAFRLLGEREEASDCAQEALARAYPRWARLTRRGDPTPWVVRVAANLAIDRWRRRHRGDDSWPIAEITPGHDDDVVTREVLHAGLAQLSKRQRDVVLLRYVGDLSERDVAEALGISTGSVKQHASRGLAALRAQMEHE